MKSTRWPKIFVAIRHPHCWKCWIPNKTLTALAIKYAKTCSDACRQRKWRGQVITTDADALEMVFGAHAADRLQDYYMGRAS